MNGWEGVNCATDINECQEQGQEQGQGCLNGAACENTVGSYVCVCGDGWAGEDCGVNIDECASNPCRNGGACVDTIGGFQCDCSGTVYVGITCEIGWCLLKNYINYNYKDEVLLIINIYEIFFFKCLIICKCLNSSAYMNILILT